MDINDIIKALDVEYTDKKTVSLKQVKEFLIAKFPIEVNGNRKINTYAPRKTDSRTLIPATEQEKKLGIKINTGKNSSLSDPR